MEKTLCYCPNMRVKCCVFFPHILCRVIFKLIGKPSVTGQGNLPQEGPYVLLANHQSILDPGSDGRYPPHYFSGGLISFKFPW